MTYAYLRLEIEENIARITFCRPERANTLNIPFATELHDAAKRCSNDHDVRAVVIQAEGKMFSAGGDLVSFSSAGDQLPETLRELLTEFHAAIETFDGMDAPVIVAVSGTAAGAGLSIVTAANLAYATKDSKFTVAYTGAGLSPDGGSTYFLPRAIGWKRCEELMLTNRVLSAEEAVQWGLLNAYFDNADDLNNTVTRVAKLLAAGATKALGHTHRLLMASANSSLKEQLEREAESIVAMGGTEDGREGITAFLEKRRPVFNRR